MLFEFQIEFRWGKELGCFSLYLTKAEAKHRFGSFIPTVYYGSGPSVIPFDNCQRRLVSIGF